MSDPLALVLGKLEGVKQNGKRSSARCPAHDDIDPSLSVSVGQDGQVILKCHAGCSFDAILAALSLSARDLYPTAGNGSASRAREIAATYDYTDEEGTVLFQTVRFIPKGFQQRRPNGLEGWTWNLEGTRRVLFHLPQLRAAVTEGRPVHIAEGEKDVIALEGVGVAATCNPMGAGKWRPEFSEHLRGAEVVIVADRDSEGRKHAAAVARALEGVARSCQIVEPVVGKDAADHLAAGRAVSEFAPLAGATVEPAGAIAPALESRPWPSPRAEAFYGLAGDFVRLIEPASEADPMALLVQLLVAFGNALNRGPYFTVEATRHHLNLFAAIIGQTSRGRKGTAWMQVRRPMALADDGWAERRIMGGLSSGEGLIAQVRDPNEAPEGDPNATHDKRLLVLESEFASTLRVMKREGSTLSALVRQAWDGSTLATLTKNNPMRAENAHISIVGHITEDELKRDLDRTEMANGFLNRFLLVCTRRSKRLPEGGVVDEAALCQLAQRLRRALDFGRRCGELRRDPEARQLWAEAYAQLSEGWPGLFGAVISRAEAQVTRLSCVYAVLDESQLVRVQHLRSALAVWAYCEASARYVFGDSLGDEVADKILTEGRKRGELDLTAMRDLFGRNVAADRIRSALELLAKYDLSQRREERSGGRPREVWSFTSFMSCVSPQCEGGPELVNNSAASPIMDNDINDKRYKEGSPSSSAHPTTHDINDIDAESASKDERLEREGIQAEGRAL